MTFAGAVRTGVVGAATTAMVVLADLAGSSTEVAVMVTVWAVTGAVQTPVLATMVPALAVQARVFVAPPVAVALKVVLVPVVRVGKAGVMAPTLTAWVVRVTEAVAVLPAALVTVRVKVFAPETAPLPKGVPLATTPTP